MVNQCHQGQHVQTMMMEKPMLLFNVMCVVTYAQIVTDFCICTEKLEIIRDRYIYKIHLKKSIFNQFFLGLQRRGRSD